MDRIKRIRKKPRKPKTVLLSIADPWDIKVASVDPVGLAARRGVSLSDIRLSKPEAPDHIWPSSGSPVKIPSPWYKPVTNPIPQTRSIERRESNKSTFPGEARPQPWTVSTRSGTNGAIPASVAPDGSIKPPRTRNDGIPRKLDDVGRLSAADGTGGEEILTDKTAPVTSHETSNETWGNSGLRVRFRNEHIYKSHKKIVDQEPSNKVSVPKNHLSDLSNDECSSAEPEVSIETVKKLEFKKHEKRLKSGSVHEIVKDREVKINGTENSNDPLLSSSVDVGNSPVSNNEDRLVTIVSQLVHWRYGNRAVSPVHLNGSLESYSSPHGTVQADAATSVNCRSVDLRHLEESFDEGSIVGASNTVAGNSSASMPSKLDEMDDIRIGRQKGVTSKFSRTESDSSTTFSNSGSTPNGSTLGSETEDDANDEEMVKKRWFFYENDFGATSNQGMASTKYYAVPVKECSEATKKIESTPFLIADSPVILSIESKLP